MTNAGDHGATAVPATTGAPAHTHDQPPIPTDPAEIQAAIEVRQRRLAGTVDELTSRLSPKELARRGSASAQQKARQAAATAQVKARQTTATAQVKARQTTATAQVRVREAMTAPDGSVRTERVGAVAAAVLAVVGVLVWRRSKS